MEPHTHTPVVNSTIIQSSKLGGKTKCFLILRVTTSVPLQVTFAFPHLDKKMSFNLGTKSFSNEQEGMLWNYGIPVFPEGNSNVPSLGPSLGRELQGAADVAHCGQGLELTTSNHYIKSLKAHSVIEQPGEQHSADRAVSCCDHYMFPFCSCVSGQTLNCDTSSLSACTYMSCVDNPLLQF